MAKLKIYTFPDQVLSKKAVPILRVEKHYRKLADDMLETMYDAPGVGLAANQVGLLERIVVIDTDYDFEELAEGIDETPEGDKGATAGVIRNKTPRIILNPEIIRREGKILFKEGCLSVPEYTAEVERSEKITLQYLDLDGRTQKLDADGLLSVCIQHEMDHLDGKLFIDRLSPLKKQMVKKKLLAERRERELQGDLTPGSDLHDMGGPRKKGS